jgi:hypothetical protein
LPRGSQDVRRLLVARGEAPVGVERALRLAEDLADRRERRPLLDRGRVGHRPLVLGGEPVDVDEAGVELRLGEEDEVADRLRPPGEEVGDLRVHVARPRPAADVLQARLVDRDHRDAVRRRAIGRAHAHVVSLALEALEEIGAGEEEEDDRDREAEKPVLRPESCRLHLRCVP